MIPRQRKYSLKKARQVLQWINSWYSKHWKSLPEEQLKDVESCLHQLDQAILAGDRNAADPLTRHLEAFAKRYIKKSPFEFAREFVIALVLALLIATAVRQVWFELYQIPTGSMRPTYREKDHLVVSKTSFGINVPLSAQHLYFNPDDVARTGVVVCTGHNLDLSDTDDWYFWVFPYKKRYIKRLIGKPGDSLYFYGGRIYGVDSDGNELRELLDAPPMQTLEHIPFTSFEGRQVSAGTPFQPKQELRHFNQALAKLAINHRRQLEGEVIGDKGLSTAYGIENFAMARLLTPEEVSTLTTHEPTDDPDALLYLELRHHPEIEGSQLFLKGRGRPEVQLATQSSIIPLHKRHVDALMQNMYTNRFWVEDGTLIPYYGGKPSRWKTGHARGLLATLPDTPDGLYEFYHGKAERIGFAGWTSSLAPDHPLYSHDPVHVAKLYNMGIELLRTVEPSDQAIQSFPTRFAYFRNGNLQLLGGTLFSHDDPVLTAFLAAEQGKESPFVDNGPPLLGESFDVQKIRDYGIKVPEKHYLLLGDNHAFSADGRFFGFVPEDNLRGTPQIIVWPPGERWGLAYRPAGNLFNLPTVLLWVAAITGFAFWYQRHRRLLKEPSFVKLSGEQE